MRTNNLLLSLLANSSANPRSSSLMHKEAYSNPYAVGGRSNSVSNPQVQKKPKALTAQNNVQLVRVVHFLNLKVKSHYYFFFCKLQQAFKNQKKLKQIEAQKIRAEQVLKEGLAEKERTSKAVLLDSQKQKSRMNGISILCDSFNTFKSKREILQQKQKTVIGFASIMRFSNKKKSVCVLSELFLKQKLKKQRQVFDLFAKMEKQRMRIQIFMQNITQIITKQKLQTFERIKLYVRECLQQQELSKKMMNSLKIQEFTLNESQNTNYKNQQQLSSKYQSCQKNNKSKKIILRERKVSATQPISSTSNKVRLAIIEDKPLVSPDFNKNQQKMIRCHNIKPDLFTSCLPDLNDNCHLFRQFEFPTFPSKAVYTIQTYYTELRETIQGECLTDRSAKHPQSQISNSYKNTPRYCKDKSSINLTVKKQVNLTNPDQSPLQKIDEILNKIEQMKSYRSTEKSSQKRSVNSNMQKTINAEQLNSIKYRMKTPTQKYQECQKENIRERLITQREKPTKKVRGLESGSKYRSTMLTKSKQQKGEFTAKKMKMQIQNIINKRNKQLYYRAESTQLN